MEKDLTSFRLKSCDVRPNSSRSSRNQDLNMAEDQQRLSTTMSSQGLWSSSESSVFIKRPTIQLKCTPKFPTKKNYILTEQYQNSWISGLLYKEAALFSKPSSRTCGLKGTSHSGALRHERDLRGHSYSPGPRPLAASGPLYPHAYPSGLPNSPPAAPTPHHPAPSTRHYWLKSSSSYVPG